MMMVVSTGCKQPHLWLKPVVDTPRCVGITKKVKCKDVGNTKCKDAKMQRWTVLEIQNAKMPTSESKYKDVQCKKEQMKMQIMFK